MADEVVDALDAAKRASTAQLLFKAARLVNDRVLEAMRERWGVPIRPAHTGVFPHVDVEGTRVTVLAERMGVSKQAVSKLVEELVEWEVFERIPDPRDGRAHLVRFAGGASGLLEGVQHLRAVEAPLWDELGPERHAALHDALSAVLELVEGEAPTGDEAG